MRGGYYVGGLAGMSYGAIENSHVKKGDVIGRGEVGGLVGKSLVGRIGGKGRIVNSNYIDGVVEAINVGGGLVGHNYGTIENSHSHAEVLGKYRFFGGFVGMNKGLITRSSAKGRVTGQDTVGYFVGDNSSCAGIIEHSYAVVTMKKSDVKKVVKFGPFDYFGGFVGWNNYGVIGVGNYYLKVMTFGGNGNDEARGIRVPVKPYNASERSGWMCQ